MAKSVFFWIPVFVFGFALAPASAFASVIFTEVMYDAPGTDSGHEWVEIENTGSEADLSGWKFFEANTNHTLTLYQGAGIAPGGYAVIADNPSKFLADYPSYSGTVFDSSFSLSNSGETLTLHDDSEANAATVAYDPSLGASGDGDTLQWNGSKWVAAPATPGAAYSGGTASDSASSPDAAASSSQGAPAQESGASAAKHIFADAGADRTVFVGADAVFTASSVGTDGEPLENARYLWTFGDGGRLEGQSVLYRYLYPGEYTVVLDVSSGGYAASDRVSVKAVPADVSITSVASDVIGLKNGADVELDLGGWILVADGKTFTFPSHTIIAPGETVLISNERTGLSPSSPEAASLEYPNGARAVSYEAPLIAARIPKSDASASRPSAPALKTAPAPAGGKVLGAETSAPNASPEKNGSGFLPWIAALSLLIAIAGGALFFFTSNAVPQEATAESADEYEIEEEKP